MSQHSALKRIAQGIFFFITLQIVTACVPLVGGTATVTVIDIIQDRRTVGRNIDDNSLEVQLRKDIVLDDHLGRSVNISVTAVNGIVLLTGEVVTESQVKRAIMLARSYHETRQVVNEIQLSGKTNITSRVNDSWITTKVKAKLIRTKNLSANVIKVVTENGKVYLLGIVTAIEAEAAVQAAKSIRGVTHIIKVFEYVDD